MKLAAIRTISGKIKVITGLHIGASNENIEIGGLDQPIIKDPLPESRAPYIPGSSLKGKMRSLLEIKEGRIGKNGTPCDCGQASCPVCPVFGTSAAVATSDIGPTRLIVRDAHLNEKWEKRFRAGDLPMEIKYENIIHRIKGTAEHPRPLERVPGGVEFDFHFSFKQFDEDPGNYFTNVLKAMKLLELDALGGSGSRGCGQIQFTHIFIDGKPQAEDFLSELDLNA